jgi:hypothetical protein
MNPRCPVDWGRRPMAGSAKDLASRLNLRLSALLRE